MKKSYFDDYGPEPRLPHEFQVPESEGRFTGILDPNGNRLYRNPSPVGFVTDFRNDKPRRIQARAAKR